MIEHKKQGLSLTREEIEAFAAGVAAERYPAYQVAALLMAIRLRGMDDRETADLTVAMARSGRMLEPGGLPLDKHSTGGVGDLVTLVLAPLIAACGGKMPLLSGRGLGHTGGTIDKLESIPGFRAELPEKEFLQIAQQVGCAVVGQTARLAPADKYLYALRDVTGTVDSIPLIASSILSKKFAAGVKVIVLDVKTGTGALMKKEEDALELARTMVRIGAQAGHKVIAVISGMDQPLSTHVGNALEVKDAIDILSGRSDGDALRLTKYLGALLLQNAGLASCREEGESLLQDALDSGRGLQKLKEMIAAQHGDPAVCDDLSLLPAAPLQIVLPAPRDGYLAAMDTVALGMIALRMGAGRLRQEDEIDPAVGFVLHRRLGERVTKGEPLCTIHARTQAQADQAAEQLLAALQWSDAPCAVPPLIRFVIDENGTHHVE